ncbi:trypsin [Oesophagostomum dentatum]|uniref:Trypsin n=1 Tax=Oesophagostomum dentatum TaxID=61180 RepID=A0A0B1TDP1_OESDE|nr:trypsin [Oesophagostomum dentatum]
MKEMARTAVFTSSDVRLYSIGQSSSENHLVKKSYGGRKFENNEYPWTVIIIAEEKQMLCSGVQISPRHILTAAHCVLLYDNVDAAKSCSSNDSYRVTSVATNPDQILVYVGTRRNDCNSLASCLLYKSLYQPTKVTSGEFTPCGPSNDIALIELSKDISQNDSTPICMPSENLDLAEVLYSSGSGQDPRSPATLSDPVGRYSRGQQVVAQKRLLTDEVLRVIITETFAKGSCPGDSGGPLFQTDENGRYILVGIASASIPGCMKPYNRRQSPYENRLAKKSYGGRKFEDNEYPWTAFIAAKEK